MGYTGLHWHTPWRALHCGCRIRGPYSCINRHYGFHVSEFLPRGSRCQQQEPWSSGGRRRGEAGAWWGGIRETGRNLGEWRGVYQYLLYTVWQRPPASHVGSAVFPGPGGPGHGGPALIQTTRLQYTAVQYTIFHNIVHQRAYVYVLIAGWLVGLGPGLAAILITAPLHIVPSSKALVYQAKCFRGIGEWLGLASEKIQYLKSN